MRCDFVIVRGALVGMVAVAVACGSPAPDRGQPDTNLPDGDRRGPASTKMVDGRALHFIPSGSASPQRTYVDAGLISLFVAGVELVMDPYAGPAYQGFLSSSWTDGDALSVTADGHVVPAFSMTASAPARRRRRETLSSRSARTWLMRS